MSVLQRQNPSFVPSRALHPTSFGGAGGTITNIVLGILALVVGIVTIWQAHRIYQIWHPTTTGMTGPECSFHLLTWLMIVLEVDLGASGAGELETEAERCTGDGIYLQPGTSQERQTSNIGDSNDSMGSPAQPTAEPLEVE